MPGRKHDTKMIIYKGRGKQPWYWKFIAPNGRNTANGSEGYVSIWNALRAAEKHLADIREGGEVEVVLQRSVKTRTVRGTVSKRQAVAAVKKVRAHRK